MKINIETIPHDQQRYETLGDYWLDENGTYQIRISEGLPEYSPPAILVHEMVEMLLCIDRDISFKSIDDFDMSFVGEEPGNDLKAPYHKEHVVADIIERIMCHELGIEWNE